MKIYHHGGKPPKHIEAALQAHQHSESILKAIRGRISLKDVKDDPASRRFAVSQIDQSRFPFINYATPHRAMKFPNLQGTSIDPTSSQMLLARGSTPNAISGTIAFASTTTTIIWTWTSLVIYRADGSTTAIPNGTITFSSLTANTPYWFNPYWSEATSAVLWAGGANTASSFISAQTMNLQSNVPLSAGSIKVTTPASGSGGGSGGGGSNGCLHPSQKVWTSKGEKDASDLVVGDLLCTPTGWAPILTLAQEDCGEWRKVTFRGGREAWVTPSQPFYLEAEQAIRADLLDAGEAVMAQYEKLGVIVNERFFEGAFKVIIGIQAPHLFYLWEGGPTLHNGIQKP